MTLDTVLVILTIAAILIPQRVPSPIGVWQGVAMDSLKFHPGPPCHTLQLAAGGPPLKRPYSRFRGACPQGGRPAAIFYRFGHPTPCAYVFSTRATPSISRAALFLDAKRRQDSRPREDRA
jgi:hypothetical protein